MRVRACAKAAAGGGLSVIATLLKSRHMGGMEGVEGMGGMGMGRREGGWADGREQTRRDETRRDGGRLASGGGQDKAREDSMRWPWAEGGDIAINTGAGPESWRW